jgi:hypothetical protein
MSSHRAVTRRAYRLTRHLALMLAVAMTVLAATSGVAFAFWGAHGTGSGSGTTGTLTVSVTSATVSTTLVPGGSSNVIVTLNNPNGATVQITAITAGTITVSAGCTTPAVTFSAPGPYGTLAAGTQAITLTNAAAMGTGSSSNCQGATFTIPITVAVKL